MKQAKTKKSIKASTENKKKPGEKGQNKKEKKLRVLILEDNPADAELMERQLKKDGITFVSRRVESKSNYLKSLKAFQPDLILADYKLPKFDALQALALRKKNAPFTPFIIVTGTVSEEITVECMKQGADDYLLKDRMARLGEAAKHALETRRLQSEKARTEAALQANEQLYHAFINASADMAFLKDDRLRHLLANRELCRFYEKSEIEIIGKTDAELMDKSAAARCRKTDRQALAENRIHVSEETIGGLTFETRKFPVKLTDGRIGVGGYIRDITERKHTQGQIEKAAQKWNITFDAIKDGIALLAVDQTIMQANQAFADIINKPFKEIIGKKCYKLIHSDQQPDRHCPFKKMLKSKKRESMELVIAERTLDIIVDPIKNNDGAITGAAHIISDITERKRAEELQQATSSRLELALYSAKAGTWDWNVLTNHIEWSPQMFKLFGLDPQSNSASFASWRTVLYPEDREGAENSIDQALKQHKTLDSDYRIILPGGQIRWINAVGVGVYDNSGRPIQMIGICQDISERKQTEKSLYESEKKYRELAELLPQTVFETDLQGMLTFVNCAAFASFGYHKNDFKGGLQIWQMLVPGDRTRAATNIKRLMAGASTGGNEYTALRKNGSEFPILLYSALIQTSGQPTGIRGILVDITERKQAEKQIQASLHEKEVLLKEIHHRVKNNLQVISGLLTLQAAQINDERLQRMIKESQSRIWTMALIHQTLYQSGNMASINMADYIRSLCGNLLSSHAQLAMPPNIIFDVLPLQLSIDKAIPLALIINELVTNAMKHAFADGRTGEIRIGLQEYRDRSRPVPTDLGRVYTFELTVADNGVGLPAGFDAKNQKSLGLQLVGMLTQQLAGQFAMESTAGTAVHILFDQNEKTQEQS